jgi:hypothetical protein
LQEDLPDEIAIRKNYLHDGHEEEKENIWVSTGERNGANR